MIIKMRMKILGSLICLMFSPFLVFAEDCKEALSLVKKAVIPTFTKQETEENLNKAILLCPDLVESYYEFGRFYLSHEQFIEAEEKFKKADKIKNRLEHVLGIAFSQLGKKDYVGAEASFKDAIGKYSGNWQLLQGLAIVYISTGRFSEAEDLLRQGIQEDSNISSLYLNLGVSLEGLSRQDEALLSYKTALQKDNKQVSAAIYLARLLLIRDEFSEAKKVIEQAMFIQPSNPDVIALQVTVNLYLGENRLADDLLSRSKDKLSDSMYSSLKAVSEIKNGFGESSLNILKENYSKNKKDMQIARAYGYALSFIGEDLDKAKEVLLDVIQNNPNDGFSLNNLGAVYEQLGERDLAKEMFLRAGKVIPLSTTIRNNLERFQ